MRAVLTQLLHGKECLFVRVLAPCPAVLAVVVSRRLTMATPLQNAALLVGLLVMIWPAMSKVQWETLPALFRARGIYIHLGISLVLNWIIAPLIMAACAWITLPEASMDRERRGVLLVGVGESI